MKGEYKTHSEPGNEQYIITVRWPVYIDIRVEAPTEDEAIELVETYVSADDYSHRNEHTVEFGCDLPGEALHDMHTQVYLEHMEIIEVEQDSPPTSLEGGE
tara:strand:+ start:180 stop:482 length:303 start_codon:yes stop_codon:yes gene_type:complete